MRKWTQCSFILGSLLIVVASILTVNAQQSTLLDSKVLIQADWSAFFPLIEGCKAEVSPLSNLQGQILQTATYKKTELKPGAGEIIIGMPLTGHSWLDSGECGLIQILMNVPYSQLVAVMSKQELKAEKERERKQKKMQKESAKHFERFKIMRPSTQPPRLVTIKGFEAYQIFGPPCELDLCESLYFTTISLKFASNKQLTIRLLGHFEKATRIIESMDFNSLSSAMDAYAETIR